MDTLRNKVVSSVMIGLGLITLIAQKDATIFVIMLLIGLPIFFAKKDVFSEWGF